MNQVKTTTLKDFLKSNSQSDNFSKYNMSNIFSVVNKGQNSYFNLSKTINFSNLQLLPESYYKLYKIKQGDTWTNIAYMEYHNINLWWLICKFNNIQNPFTELIVNKVIKLPSQNLINDIIDSMNS